MASRPKRKRTKAYRPKHIQIPVMPELQREFMMTAHGALASIRLAPSVPAFDQLAGVFNVVHVALLDLGRSSMILESGMRALIDVATRMERTGAIGIGRHQLAPIELATFECERLVPTLDIMGLYVAQQKIRFAALESRITPATTRITPASAP